MSRILLETAYDNITFRPIITTTTPLATTLTSNVAYPLVDYLTLELTNTKDLVEVEGQITFKLVTGSIALSTNYSISTTISVYRGSATGDLAYQLVDVKPYANATAVLLASAEVEWTLPIRFVEVAPLMATEDTVNYYVVVQVNPSPAITTGTTITLQQYSISASEIPQCIAPACSC